MAPLAVAGELLGGLGLIVGLFTRVAAFGVMCVMVVAIATVHLHKGLLAEHGGFEYPLLLLATSLYFLVAGGGPVSLDAACAGGRTGGRSNGTRRWQRPPYVPETTPAREVTGRAAVRPVRPSRRSADPRLHRH